MSLLQICQDAADEIGITQPSSVANNAAPEALTLYRLANKVGNRLMKAYPWQVLRAETTFTSVATEAQTSILPSDFDRIVPETFWNRTDKVLISGPVSPVQWQGLKANSYSDTSRPKFAYRGGSILVTPTLAAGKTLAFEYVKKNWAESSGSTAQSEFSADGDTALLDEELITLGLVFEFLDQKGQPTGKAASAYVERFNLLVENERADDGIMVSADIFGGGRHFTGSPPVDGDSSVI